MLVALCVRGFKKNAPAMPVKLRLCLWVQKMHPQQCRLLFVSAGSKKCTRDVSEVTAVFMGSKKCTRKGVCCYLCLWVQKNVPTDRAEWLCVKCCHALLLAT